MSKILIPANQDGNEEFVFSKATIQRLREIQENQASMEFRFAHIVGLKPWSGPQS